jgi:nitrate/TMAO reductase-like tetraheme cytochrome c subunit
MRRLRHGWVGLLWLSIGACTNSKPGEPAAPEFTLTREELLDPRSCKSCHPGQFAEWQGSMHAFAASDPVFLAMNRRGQEETNGELGSFCVNCHAPVAVQEGLTTDGLNLEKLGYEYQGVTCYFCHSVESVPGTHNNPLRLRKDAVLGGPFDDPQHNDAHASTYATHTDSKRSHSSKACGACHDVRLEPPLTSAALDLERTFAEYQTTLFAQEQEAGFLTCNDCHMPISATRDRSATTKGAPKRSSRRHDFEGIDIPSGTAATGDSTHEWPGQERQQLLVDQFLAATLIGEVCVSQEGVIEVTLENAGAGHHFPSGASHNRLVWLELTAANETLGPIFRTTDPEAALSPFLAGDAGTDAADGGVISALPRTSEAPVLTDVVAQADGRPAHMFWEVAQKVSTSTLPGRITNDPLDSNYHAERGSWRFDTGESAPNTIDTVDLTVHVRPIKWSVLNSLYESGHLSREVTPSDLRVRPNRCYDADSLARFPDIVQAADPNCDPAAPEYQTTLRWRRTDAKSGTRGFRATELAGAPALCLAHAGF